VTFSPRTISPTSFDLVQHWSSGSDGLKLHGIRSQAAIGYLAFDPCLLRDWTHGEVLVKYRALSRVRFAHDSAPFTITFPRIPFTRPRILLALEGHVGETFLFHLAAKFVTIEGFVSRLDKQRCRTKRDVMSDGLQFHHPRTRTKRM
jgi:hypothetical protein